MREKCEILNKSIRKFKVELLERCLYNSKKRRISKTAKESSKSVRLLKVLTILQNTPNIGSIRET